MCASTTEYNTDPIGQVTSLSQNTSESLLSQRAAHFYRQGGDVNQIEDTIALNHSHRL